MNRVVLTAATQTEFAQKLTVIEAIGGTLDTTTITAAHGAIKFKVEFSDLQLALYKELRKIPLG